jgi:1-deoxy-D-xylulose-5-phosphate reductoisomerase
MTPQNKKGIAILGSTGSIGTQALEVIEQHKNNFSVEVLSANSNIKLLAEQVRKFKPNCIIITDETKYADLKRELQYEDVKIFCGIDAVCQAMQMSTIDIVLTAMVGYAGLKPTIAAIKAKKNIALANKETLVVAGELITNLAKQHGVNIYPVDSEHSAIFQCITGEFHNPIEKIYLTASGGPFRGYKKEQLEKVTPLQALKHPNWSMGNKITIDSATLMNKGLEVIEAHWLFGLNEKQIDIIVHPQSIIHSIVQFTDGSMKAQMGLPDMRLPIQFALTYPQRLKNNFKRFDFLNYPQLTFEKPDYETFINLSLAFEAMKMGGNAACILNAANEITVQAFLNQKISFLQIGLINQKVLFNRDLFCPKPSLNDFVESNRLAREYAQLLC